MQPTGSQLQRICDALRSAYPTYADLDMFVRLRMDADLAAIAPVIGRNQTQIVYSLVRHFGAQTAGLHRLLTSAIEDCPGNPDLVAAADLLAVPFDPLPLPRQDEGPKRLWVGVPALPNRDRIVGRQELLDDLVQRLLAGKSPALSADGLPGVGKTTMAVLLAHDERVRDHFPDGVLWVGLGQNADVASIQATWGEALGAELKDVLDVRIRQERLNAALGDRRVLVVLDDAWQVEPAQQLRLNGPGVAHVLTTRNGSIARQFAGASQSVKVNVLDDHTAWELLQTLAPEACAAQPDAARRLANTVGGLPLAIELLGGYLAAPELTYFPDLTAEALEELHDPRRRPALAQERLGSVTGRQETLNAVIRLSVDELSAEAEMAFYALGAFAPKPASFDRVAAEAVAEATAGTLALLAARNLVEVADGNLAVHQVVHDVMAASPDEAARARHGEYYLAAVDEDRENWQKIEALLPQVRWAWQQVPDRDGRLSAFMWAMRVYFERRGLGAEHLGWAVRAQEAARETGDDGTVAALLNNIGMVYADLGEPQQALDYYNQALPLWRQVGDRAGEATTLSNIGAVYDILGEQQQALDYYNQVLPIKRQVGDRAGEAITLNNIGLVYSAMGEQQQALDYYNQALPVARQIGDRVGEATTLNNIGLAYSALSDNQQALEYYHQALPIRRQVGDHAGEATTLNNIGAVYADLGEQQQALQYYPQALPIARQVGNRTGEARTLSNIGRFYSVLGEQQQALNYLNQALPILREVGDRAGEAATLNNIGLVYAAVGDKQQALDYYCQALHIMCQVGGRAGEAATLSNIGLVYSAMGEPQQALDYYNQALPIRRQVGDRAGEAATLNNIGGVYADQGEQQQALDYYNQALPIVRQIGDRVGEATTLNNIGLAYSALSDNQQALEYYNQALPIRRQVGDRAGEAVTCYNMAMAHAALGDLSMAAALLELTVAIDGAIGHPNLDRHRATLNQVHARIENQKPGGLRSSIVRFWSQSTGRRLTD